MAPAPSIAEIVKRPVKYLSVFTECYKGIWKAVDWLRTNRDDVMAKHPWPSWCYLPFGGAQAIFNGVARRGRETHFNSETHSKMGGARTAILGSWRLAKDIYVFDETVLEELWETPIDGAIPIEALHKLPTWCAYIAFPAPRSMEGKTAHGFFVHLTYGVTMPVLLMAIAWHSLEHIAPDSLICLPVELQEGRSLLESLTAANEKAKAKGIVPSPEIAVVVSPERIAGWAAPLLSLTIYLCSASAEIRQRDPLRGLRNKVTIKKTKKGLRTFVPYEPQVWEVAYRIGATLRAAKAASPGSGDGSGSHASPRPHIRRAHWHSYWTGPKAAVGQLPVPPREIVVHWIPPTPVAMKPGDEAIPTVHRVTN